MSAPDALLHSFRPSGAAVLAASFLLALFGCQSSTNAQETDSSPDDSLLVVPAPDARMSPMAIASAMLDGDTYVKVVYSSPRKRDRTIFGGLVPFGEIWRTGANEATEITVTSAVRFGPEYLRAGTYSLFTIPGDQRWTVIVNANLGQWGAYDYDATADLFRFDVEAAKSDKIHEAFTIAVDAGDDPAVRLVWDRTEVVIPLGVER